jgi:hypothetical protein
MVEGPNPTVEELGLSSNLEGFVPRLQSCKKTDLR